MPIDVTDPALEQRLQGMVIRAEALSAQAVELEREFERLDDAFGDAQTAEAAEALLPAYQRLLDRAERLADDAGRLDDDHTDGLDAVQAWSSLVDDQHSREGERLERVLDSVVEIAGETLQTADVVFSDADYSMDQIREFAADMRNGNGEQWGVYKSDPDAVTEAKSGARKIYG